MGSKEDSKKWILEILQDHSTPISKEQICKESPLISKSKFLKAVKELRDEGYDIKKTLYKGKSRYSLVRNANPSMEDYYRIQGKLRTPFLHTSDWHLGSSSASMQAINKLLDDIGEYKIKDVVHCGDIIQGLGVYRTEAADLEMFLIDEQVDAAVDILNQIPSRVNVHMVIGNHEDKIKSKYKAGFDAVRSIASRTKNNYYGHVGKLQINKSKQTALMMHGSGGMAYAISYSVQKIWRNLIEHPSLLLTGHLHKCFTAMMPPDAFMMQVGTLQRESSWIQSKGLTTDMNYNIVHDFSPESMQVTYKRPWVY